MKQQRLKKERLLDLRMALFIQESGKVMHDMDMVYKSGLMVPSTKVIGKMEKQMVKENSFMSMEIFMKVNGVMIKQVDMEFTYIIMVPNMKVNGLTIISMDRGSKAGSMEVNMKEDIKKEKRMGMENMSGEMQVIMMVNGPIIRLLALELTFGLMGENILVIG
jgi:hypothetical protein